MTWDLEDERAHRRNLERLDKPRMRIYVASKFENKETVRAVQAQLREHGHSITYDWTTAEHATAVLRDEAVKDFAGVIACEVFLFLWHPDCKGALVEMGAALHPVPRGPSVNDVNFRRVIVVGCPRDAQPNVFFHHPRVKHYASVSDAIDGEAL